MRKAKELSVDTRDWTTGLVVNVYEKGQRTECRH